MIRSERPALRAAPLGRRVLEKAVPGSARLLRALSVLLLAGCAAANDPLPAFALPELDAADYRWIGARIYQNEARGQARYLTWWNEGEDFPSLGIGHFIWFPAGIDAPFDETFPTLVAELLAADIDCVEPPVWLVELAGREAVDAPWSSKAEFDAAGDSERMRSLRAWLAATAEHQARFIAKNFVRRWNSLTLQDAELAQLTAQLERLISTPQGLFAAIDYFNFKGLGTNPRERYAGEGWGLLQVLETMAGLQSEQSEPLNDVAAFAAAAERRLTRRVELAPPERNEARWLPGWRNRLGDYQASTDTSKHHGFRVLPYLQQPGVDSVTVSWFSATAAAGELLVRSDVELRRESSPEPACELRYHPAEIQDLDSGRLPTVPYHHQVRLKGLQPGQRHRYQVTQAGQVATGEFFVPRSDDEVRFVVYADSETEPESTGSFTPWNSAGDEAGAATYPVDQTDGYAANLRAMEAWQPDFVAIAGDLVESGGEQRDWDEFWRHNGSLLAKSYLFPALGNHDYYSGPGDFGSYRNAPTAAAVAKYKRYFALADNASEDPTSNESYYAQSFGPVTLIVIDGNDGVPHRSDQDTNWYLRPRSDGGPAPAWNPGTEQYAWLESELARAQQVSQFTFVMFHAAPYSSGVHGLPPGLDAGEDYLPGTPLQALTPLFHRYGVDAVFNGHDERYEHSVVTGIEITPAGEAEHAIHFFTVGIGGDGLRGAWPGLENPYRVFDTARDAPAEFSADGELIAGGAHYGHLRVTVEQDDTGGWLATMDPVYLLPRRKPSGAGYRFELRHYADLTRLYRPAKPVEVAP